LVNELSESIRGGRFARFDRPMGVASRGHARPKVLIQVNNDASGEKLGV
jgi:hypothetical protein